jgi:hypothetical protein
VQQEQQKQQPQQQQQQQQQQQEHPQVEQQQQQQVHLQLPIAWWSKCVIPAWRASKWPAQQGLLSLGSGLSSCCDALGQRRGGAVGFCAGTWNSQQPAVIWHFYTAIQGLKTSHGSAHCVVSCRQACAPAAR